MLNKIDIQNKQTSCIISKPLERDLSRVCEAATELEALDAPYEVAIVIVSDEQIRVLNRDFRGKDVPTDVLSFPAHELDMPLVDKIREEDFEPEMEKNRLLLGDIAISVERAALQADEFGHSLTREICFLCAHGMLHLLGYDHETEEDEHIMRTKQTEIMELVDIKRV